MATVLPAVLSTVAGLTVAAAISGSSPALRAASYADGSPIGELSHSIIVPGGLLVRGWDFDTDAPRQPLWTFAKVDGTRVGRTRANKERAFLTQEHPKAGPDHGFKWVVPVPEGEHKVCIAASSIGRGPASRLGCVTHTFDYGPFGHIDEINTVPGAIHVKGWTIDHDDPTQALTTTVIIDGYAHTLLANKKRSDVAAKHPVAGADHGFEATYHVSQGEHTVCVTATNIGYGSDNTLGCSTLTLDDSPIGDVAVLARHGAGIRVRGWAFDPDRPTRPVNVRVVVDRSRTEVLLANRPRHDVAQAHPEAGPDHGFGFQINLPEGQHRVCVSARNIGYGHRSMLTCRTVTLDYTPTATILHASATRTGVWVKGWAADPDTTTPINVRISVDKHLVDTLTASKDFANHPGHGFGTAVPMTSGKHTICIVGVNVLYGTHNSPPSCTTMTFSFAPLGSFTSLARAGGGSTDLLVRGWAFDPDTTGPISVAMTFDGAADGSTTADHWRRDLGRHFPRFGHRHGIAAKLAADDGEHTVCLVARNVRGGQDTNLGCKTINAVNPEPPTAPQNVTATASYGAATVTWDPPASDGGAPWSNYVVTASPGGASVTVDGNTDTATVSGLKPKTAYQFAVTAINVAGSSAPGTSNQVTTPGGPRPQRTPAPVSTSRYIRNITGSSTDLAKMRGEGYKDARANPSGHRYLILLDIGGQDEYDGGVVLSATTRFVSYGDLERDLRAYVDGYHNGQRSTAPAIIAVGTNNDMDVSNSSGVSWATKIVGPLRRYASKYSGMTIAGANDIEPGFRATYKQSSAWLTGYLSATKAPFVFNGSADGCSWTTTNAGCNNGWRMTGLYHLAEGAAPGRIINLPQIYNTTMAAQWKYISLTGLSHGSPRIAFGGPLTEWTACEQDRSCGSLTGHSAWTTLWRNLQSDSRLRISSLPYSTDLRIDR